MKKFTIPNIIARLPIPYSFWSALEKLSVYCKGQGYNSENNVVHEVACIANMVASKTPIVLYDMGANEGQYSVAFISKFKDLLTKVYMFEPEPTLFEVLSSKFSQHSSIVLSNKALSNTSGFSTLMTTTIPGSLYGSLVVRDTSRYGFKMDTKFEVETIRFDEYCNEQMISELNDNKILKVLKMDVEGHEMNVLKGIGKYIKKIDILQFEFGHCHIDSRTFFKDFWDFFNKELFSIYLITPRGVYKYDEYSDRHEMFMTTNYIAVNNNSVGSVVQVHL
jgi:FkbM family methyltransferase